MMKTFGLTFTLLVVLPLVLSGPVGSGNSCSPECKTSRSKFMYEAGQTYSYAFETSTKTNVAFASATEDAVLSVKGEALLTFRTACDVSIELTKTSIRGQDSKSIDSSALEKFSTVVSFQDGNIDSICSHPNDAAWAVNIKRAVLSMLQHSAQLLEVSEEHVYENDMVGRCATEYIVTETGKTVRVVKTKVPNQCSQRQSRESSMLSVAYDTKAETQVLPLLNSTSTCEQKITDGIIVSTMCKEVHLFRPLSSELEGGARTEASSSITFVQKSGAKSVSTAAGIAKESDLTFDHSATKLAMDSVRNIDVIVNSLCSQMEDGSSSGSSELFSELVRSMRTATPKAIKASYSNLINKKNCKENKKTKMIFLDALPQAGSDGSIMLMSELLQADKISARQSLGWYLSFPIAKYVTVGAIKSLVPLVDATSESPMALLGITGMVHRICMKNMEACQVSKDVLSMSEHLGNLVDCQSKDQTKTLSALKALGNMVAMPPKVQDSVASCIRSLSVSTPVRLAAIGAFRSSPCDTTRDNVFLSVLESEEDDEVVIAAYLAAMRCPQAAENTLLRITSYLNQDDVETSTVRTFIRTHLTNIRNNPTPGMEHVRDLVKKMTFATTSADRFTTRNSVAADFCTANNVGYNADLNVIYTEESKIPRSATLNLTLDLFGQSVNLFEIGARAENLDRPLAALVKKFLNRESVLFNKNDESEVKLDAFMRVFGSEIGMLAYRGGDSSGVSSVDLRTRISEAMQQLMQGAKKVDIDVARSFMFLDSSASFPTVAGMPIRLAVNGSTTVALALESRLDIPALMRDPRNFDIRVKVSPFAVTQLSASMTVDMSIAESGIKMASTIHSSAAVDFSATRKQNKQLEVRLDLPQSKMTLIDFSSQLFRVYHAGNDKQVKKIAIMNEMEYKHGGCSERLTPVTGLRLCAQSRLNVPRPLSNPKMDAAPSFPLSGHGAFSVVLEKTDASMKGFHLKLDITDKSNSKSRSQHFKLEGVMSTSPSSEFRFETELRNTQTKSLSLKITRNNQNYYAKIQLNVDNQKDVNTYTTSVEIEHPAQARAVIFEGKVAHRVGKSMEISAKPAGPYARVPMQLQATISREMSAHVTKVSLTDVTFVTPLGSAVINTAEINLQKDSSSAVFDMTYGAEKHSVVFDARVVTQPTVFKSAVNYKSSRFPQSNYGVSFMRVNDKGVRSNKLIITHGPESEQAVNRLTLSQSLNLGTDDEARVDNNFAVKYPLYGIDYEVDQTYRYDVDEAIARGSFSFLSNNKRIIDSMLKLEITPEAGTIYKLDTKAAFMDKTLTIQDTCKMIAEDHFTTNPILILQSGSRTYEMVGKITGMFGHEGTSISLEADVKGNGIANPMKFYHSFQLTDDMFSTSNKLSVGDKTNFAFDTKAFRSFNLDMSFFLADIIDTKFAVTDKSSDLSEAEINLDMNFLRLERHIKVKALYRENNDNGHLTQNPYVQIQWDATKDPTQQISLDFAVTDKSNYKEFSMGHDDDSLYDGPEALDRIFDIRGTLTVEDRPYSLHVSTDRDLGFEKVKALVEIQLPSQKKMKLVIGNTFTNTRSSINNVFEFETVLFSGMNYRVDSVMGISNLAFDQSKPQSIIHETTVKSSNNEDIKIKMEFVRSIDKRRSKTTNEAKLVVKAPKYVISNDFDMFAKFEYDRQSFLVSSGYKRNSGKYDVFLGEVSGSLIISNETGTKVLGNINFKVAEHKKFEFFLDHTISHDYGGGLVYQMKEVITIAYGGERYYSMEQSITLREALLEIAQNEIYFPTDTRQGFTLVAKFGFDLQPFIDASMTANWSDAAAPSRPMRRRFKTREVQKISKEIRIDLKFENFRYSPMTIRLSAATPFEGFKSANLNIDLDPSVDCITKLNVTAALEKTEIKLDLVFDQSPPQYHLYAKLTHSEYQPITLDVTVENEYRMALKSRVEHGQAYFVVDGSLKNKDDGGQEISVLVDSPAMGIHQYEVSGQIKYYNNSGSRRDIELVVKKMGTVLGNVKTIVSGRSITTLREFQGTAEFNVVEPQMGGSVKFLFQDRYAKDGNQYIVKLTSKELGSIVVKSKLVSLEKSANIEVCSIKNSCNGLDFSFVENNKLKKKSLTLLVKNSDGSFKEARGIRALHLSNDNTFEQNFEVIISQAQSKNIGYKATRKENNYSVELFTPKRTSAVSYDIVPGANKEKQHTVTVWADKTNSPDRKLEVVYTGRQSQKNDMSGIKASLTVKHPLLPRDIKMDMEHHCTSSGNYHSETILDLDVFDPVHQRWVVKSEIKAWTDEKVKIVTELRSQGTQDSIILDYHRDTSTDLDIGANLKFKSKNTVQKELFISLDTSSDSGNPALTFRLGSPVKQFSVESRLDYDQSGLHFKTVTQLFGLSPSVFLVDAEQSQFHVKVFNEATPEIVNHFTVVVDKALRLGFVQHIGAEKKEIAFFSSEFKTEDVLTTRLVWKLQDLAAVRSALQSRSQAVIKEASFTFRELSKDLKAITSKWAAFKNLRPGMKTLAAEAGKEVEKFAKDSDRDESLQLVLNVYRTLSQSLAFLDLSGACEVVEREVVQFVQGFSMMLSHTVDHQIQQIGYLAKDIKTYLLEDEQLLPAIKKSLRTVSQTLKRFLSSLDERIQGAAEWYDSFGSDEKVGALASLKSNLRSYVRKMEQHAILAVMHYKVMLEELVFAPYDELYASIVAKYPEYTRFLHRNVDVYVQRARTAIKENNYYNEKLAEIKRLLEETKTPAPAKKGKSATEFVNNLYSMAGEFVIYDIQKGEIQHELPLGRASDAVRLVREESSSTITSYLGNLFTLVF